MSTLKRRRGGGEELLAYKDGGRWHDLKSPDINVYVKEATGGDFSAKDFRTWSGTVLAAVALSVSGMASTSKTARKRAKARAVKEVARYLGNTPAVCRASYIDSRVFDRFDGGLTISGALPELMEDTAAWPDVQQAVEEAVLDLLAYDRGSEAVEGVGELREGLSDVSRAEVVSVGGAGAPGRAAAHDRYRCPGRRVRMFARCPGSPSTPATTRRGRRRSPRRCSRPRPAARAGR